MYRSGLLVFALSASLTACGGGDGGDGTGPPSGPPQITGISPNPMIEGQIATISGRNFASNTASNVVLLDSVQLMVSAATSTSLTVTVPPGCGPARVATLEVTVFSLTTGPVSASVSPDPNSPTPQAVSLAVRSSTKRAIASIWDRAPRVPNTFSAFSRRARAVTSFAT